LLTVTTIVNTELVKHAFQEVPKECCGILAGRGNAIQQNYRITNTARNSSKFIMKSDEQIQAMSDIKQNGLNILGFYHSHPNGVQNPSSSDIKMAIQSGWSGDTIFHVIVALENDTTPLISAYNIFKSGLVIRQPLKLA